MDTQTGPNPIIIQSGDSAPYGSSNNQKKIFNFWKIVQKIVFLLLFFVVVAEIIIGINTLVLTKPQIAQIAQVKAISGGQIYLVPNSKDITVDTQLGVKLRVDTGGRTIIGADIIVKYDPHLLEPLPNFFNSGSMFDEYPVVSVKDNQIVLSGITSPSKVGFNGIDLFGEVWFKAKSKGVTHLTVELQPNSTSDSNLTEAQTIQDILQKAPPLKVEIK